MRHFFAQFIGSFKRPAQEIGTPPAIFAHFPGKDCVSATGTVIDGH
jgi:hypothetical protein